MELQEEQLLRNPLFADPRDPRFEALRAQPFQDLVKEALTVQASERKGDWGLPTDREVAEEARRFLGMAQPAGFSAPSPEPEPPKPPTPPPPQGQWKVRGDSGKIWEVTQKADGLWDCSCPAPKPCKHIGDIQTRVGRPPSEAAQPVLGAIRPVVLPPESNTRVPAGGILLGGGPAPESPDPWAAPTTAPEVKTAPPGAKIQFRRGVK